MDDRLLIRRGTLFLAIFLLSFFLLFAQQTIQIVQLNSARFLFIQAVLNPRLDYISRQSALRNINTLSRGIDFEIERKANREVEELVMAQRYLDNNQKTAGFSPGRQLLVNPDFDFGLNGWTVYNSSWVVANVVRGSRPDMVAVAHRDNEKLGHLSQMLYIKPGCYLFSVVGKTEREDDIATLWMYWATHDNIGRAHGNVIEYGKDNLQCRRTYGVFCLEGEESIKQKVNIAPLSIRGKVTAFLSSARLYELQLDASFKQEVH